MNTLRCLFFALLLLLWAQLCCRAGEENVRVNEIEAAMVTRSFMTAQERFRRTDWDADGILEYSQTLHGGSRQSPGAADSATLLKPSADESKRIDAAIQALGSDSFDSREKAAAELQALGMKALEQLQTAARSAADAEVIQRASRLAEQARWALAPPRSVELRHGLYSSGREDAADGDVALIEKTLAKAECPAGSDAAACTPRSGYLFRVLTSQGANAPGGARSFLANGNLTMGYGLLAFPADYGNSGKRVIISSNSGMLYHRDFGSKEATETYAKHCTEFNPTHEWSKGQSAWQPLAE